MTVVIINFLEEIEMTLTSRKMVIILLVGTIFLLGNILVVANWIADPMLNFVSVCE